MSAFATVADVSLLMDLTAAQQTKATSLLDLVSDRLRYEAKKVGKNLDAMVTADSVYASVVKSVTAGIVERTIKLMVDDSPIVSQYSESALGYSFSGTVPNPGESLYIKNNELKALGLRNQKIGVLNFDGQN